MVQIQNVYTGAEEHSLLFLPFLLFFFLHFIQWFVEKYSACVYFMVRLDFSPICDGNVPSQKDGRKQNVDQIYMDTNK
jgi:hypothetical protein